MYVEFDLLVFAPGGALSFLSSLPCFSNMTWPWQRSITGGSTGSHFPPDRHPQIGLWDDELQGLVTFIFPTPTSSSLNSSPLTSFLLVGGRKWKPRSRKIMKLLRDRGLIVQTHYILNSIEWHWMTPRKCLLPLAYSKRDSMCWCTPLEVFSQLIHTTYWFRHIASLRYLIVFKCQHEWWYCWEIITGLAGLNELTSNQTAEWHWWLAVWLAELIYFSPAGI